MEKLLNQLYLNFPVDKAVSCHKIYKANPEKDIISITLKYYDKDNELLDSYTIRFNKNLISKSQQKLFKNISHKEVENSFLYAKDEIISELINENNEEIKKLNDENNKLHGMLNHKFIQSVVKSDIKIPNSNSNENKSKNKLSSLM